MFKIQFYESIKVSELVVHFHTPNCYIGLGPTLLQRQCFCPHHSLPFLIQFYQIKS